MKQPIKSLEELLDSVRDIEGFPIGKDEDILKLSNPPYYTACPNPYINDFIEEFGTPYDEATDDYHRDPFVGDVSEGKNNPIYNAHSYHTKVPHTAIMKYIEHYTDEDDIVFDGFCGTGMTGVAAQMLNRKAILSDLSPIATFIANGLNSNVDIGLLEQLSNNIFKELTEECEWIYKTIHHSDLMVNQESILNDATEQGVIDFILYSDVLFCSVCGSEYIYYDLAMDSAAKKIKDSYNCSSCNANIDKKSSKLKMFKSFDKSIGENINCVETVPVIINYTYKNKRYIKTPDKNDFILENKIQDLDIPYWFPTNRLPEGKETRRNDKIGITHAHHFYTKRNLWVMSAFFNKVLKLPKSIQNILLLAHSAATPTASKLRRFRPDGKGGGPLSGTLYVASLTTPANVIKTLSRNYTSILKALKYKMSMSSPSIVGVNSITNLPIPKNSIDYIFTDPPFGSNFMYAELNSIWELWLKITTSKSVEAIVDTTLNKSELDYSELMTKGFKKYYAVLKPNRWITIEFNNSKSSIWNIIQSSVIRAGFIIANVAVLDKKQASFKQVLNVNVAKNDLIITAYKPNESFQQKFLEQAGEGLEEEFIKMHLNHLPSEPSIERTEQMLYSKLLAYYVQRSYTVKYNASTFYKMLRENFVEEDGFWFISTQIESYLEYKQKMKLEGIDGINTGQLNLFVSDEKSALVWLHNFLNEPKDFQVIHPAFTKVASISGDIVPDIKELLQDNFVLENDKYRRPQSEDEKESVSKKREKSLIREFEEILLEAKGSKKKIKECRKQAILYGFEQCYKQEKFQDILEIGKKLNKAIIENDSEISEFIEVAEIKVEGF